jgi:hypothetical protein
MLLPKSSSAGLQNNMPVQAVCFVQANSFVNNDNCKMNRFTVTMAIDRIKAAIKRLLQ